MALGLQDFAGCWTLRREIAGADRAPMGCFEGRAQFVLEGATLIYRETGRLTLDAQSMEARQTHTWRQDGARIFVTFADGRPFHHFDTSVSTPRARHLCAADTYVVSYDFGQWPEWEAEWAVTGPSKDYRLRSSYRRVSDDEDQAGSADRIID